jgi:glycosyltransferase involved in cell wall biosynthesis
MKLACLPAFNEETAIGSVVLKTKQFVDKVIVIDDGSKDDTVALAHLAGAEVLCHDRNKGYGAAIQSCFAAAKAENADVMVIIDADGQHYAEDIPKLINPVLNEGYDFVIGSRFLDKDTVIPRYRKMGIKLLTICTNIGSKQEITDSQSGFRAYSKNAILKLQSSISGMGVGSELILSANEAGLKITEIPIRCKYEGVDGSTHNPVVHGMSVLYSILSLIKDKKPLLFLGVPGFIFLAGGLYLGLETVEVYNTTNFFPVGKSLLALLFILIATFAIFSAFILDSIQKIMKKRLS